MISYLIVIAASSALTWYTSRKLYKRKPKIVASKKETEQAAENQE